MVLVAEVVVLVEVVLDVTAVEGVPVALLVEVVEVVVGISDALKTSTEAGCGYVPYVVVGIV